MLAGVYRFRAVNAMEYTPIKELQGEYSISSKDTGSWKSDKDGEIYLDHLKVGLTNLQIKNDPDYFDMVINGAKVMKTNSNNLQSLYGRSAIMIPRTIEKEIILTLSWIGPEFQLNLIAETFIDTTEGIKKGENCVLSFGQPKCHGM